MVRAAPYDIDKIYDNWIAAAVSGASEERKASRGGLMLCVCARPHWLAVTIPYEFLGSNYKFLSCRGAVCHGSATPGPGPFLSLSFAPHCKPLESRKVGRVPRNDSATRISPSLPRVIAFCRMQVPGANHRQAPGTLVWMGAIEMYPF